MIAVTKYQCELCGKSYSTETEAIQCELKHATDLELTEKFYSPYSPIKAGYISFPAHVVIRDKFSKREAVYSFSDPRDDSIVTSLSHP